jgi:molecular chaperone DnaJ
LILEAVDPLDPSTKATYVSVVARDYYRTLGVSKGATDAEIKRAYRRLARKLHPDVTGDDPKSTERFKEITEAYDVLSDGKRRRTYDLFGAQGVSSGGGRGTRQTDPPFSDIADLFANVMSRGKKRSGPEPGVDVEHKVRVTLAEALRGVERTIDLELLRPCPDCGGKGWPSDKPPETCPDCNGTGQKSGGVLPLGRTCSRCEGTGKVRRYTCKACAGEGARDVKDRLKVTIPAGVDDGTRLRMKGRGSAGRDAGPPGDLYVIVEVADDARFEREGTDLLTEVKVGLKDALLGAVIEVPLPDGAAKMSLPAGTQGGQTFRLKGKGFPKLAGTAAVPARGDVLVTVQLRVPKGLDAESRALLEQLSARVPDL